MYDGCKNEIDTLTPKKRRRRNFYLNKMDTFYFFNESTSC